MAALLTDVNQDSEEAARSSRRQHPIDAWRIGTYREAELTAAAVAAGF